MEQFALAMNCLNPQSYGGRIANRLSMELGLSNSDNIDKGDKKINKLYLEFKGSIITSSNSQLNLVQIRPWQEIDGYIFYMWDIRNIDNIKLYFFYLSINDMRFELKNRKISNAHGTNKANKNNKNIELALRIDINSNDFNYWIKNYYYSLDKLMVKLNEINRNY